MYRKHGAVLFSKNNPKVLLTRADQTASWKLTLHCSVFHSSKFAELSVDWRGVSQVHDAVDHGPSPCGLARVLGVTCCRVDDVALQPAGHFDISWYLLMLDLQHSL